jgi:hypothetical protein
MANDALSTYVEDHLAGATAGLELLEALSAQHQGDATGALARSLLPEVEDDRRTLEGIARALDAGSALKEAGAWIAEKVSGLKLHREAKGVLGTFEALEAMTLGVLGKRALWRALAVAASTEPRLAGIDFDGLAACADRQHALLEDERLRAAAIALRP